MNASNASNDISVRLIIYFDAYPQQLCNESIHLHS